MPRERYRVSRLIERYGSDAKLTDLLTIADCPKANWCRVA